MLYEYKYNFIILMYFKAMFFTKLYIQEIFCNSHCIYFQIVSPHVVLECCSLCLICNI